MITIYWIVDGCKGNTQLNTRDRKRAKEYFDLMFAPYGYKLIRIE